MILFQSLHYPSVTPVKLLVVAQKEYEWGMHANTSTDLLLREKMILLPTIHDTDTLFAESDSVTNTTCYNYIHCPSRSCHLEVSSSERQEEQEDICSVCNPGWIHSN